MPQYLYEILDAGLHMAKQSKKKAVTRKEMSRLKKEQRQRDIILFGTIIVVALVVAVVIFGIVNEYVLKGRRAVAVVNGEKITLNQFQANVRYSRYQLLQQYVRGYQLYQAFSSDPSLAQSFADNLTQIEGELSADNLTQLGDTVLQQSIDELIIAQQAEQMGISVSPQEVDDYLQGAFGYYPDGTPTPTMTVTPFSTPTLSATQYALVSPTPTRTITPTPTNTPETATATLEATPTISATPAVTATPEGPTATPTPYTLEEYQTNLTNLYNDIRQYDLTEQDIREAVSAGLLRDKVENNITADLKPEEEEVWARHILVADEQTANQVLDLLNQGEDWTKLAAEYSTDTSNKDKGGDLGWFPRGQMVKEFEDVAFSLPIGAISDPVQTDFGWHIIQVLGHEVRPLTQNQFLTLKDTTFSTWLDNQKATANIQTNNNWQNNVPDIPTIPADILVPTP
jgi:peptidyl-prolyl cis-trans isomerase D